MRLKKTLLKHPVNCCCCVRSDKDNPVLACACAPALAAGPATPVLLLPPPPPPLLLLPPPPPPPLAAQPPLSHLLHLPRCLLPQSHLLPRCHLPRQPGVLLHQQIKTMQSSSLQQEMAPGAAAAMSTARLQDVDLATWTCTLACRPSSVIVDDPFEHQTMRRLLLGRQAALNHLDRRCLHSSRPHRSPAPHPRLRTRPQTHLRPHAAALARGPLPSGTHRWLLCTRLSALWCSRYRLHNAQMLALSQRLDWR